MIIHDHLWLMITSAFAKFLVFIFVNLFSNVQNHPSDGTLNRFLVQNCGTHLTNFVKEKKPFWFPFFKCFLKQLFGLHSYTSVVSFVFNRFISLNLLNGSAVVGTGKRNGVNCNATTYTLELELNKFSSFCAFPFEGVKPILFQFQKPDLAPN